MSSTKKPVRNSQRWCSNHHLVLPSSLCVSPLLFKLISFSLTLHNSIISSLYISFVQVIFFFCYLQLRYCLLREKCQNAEFFLVHIFLYLDWIQANTDQKIFRTWTIFTQWLFKNVFGCWNLFQCSNVFLGVQT